jgi:hypothetical protein
MNDAAAQRPFNGAGRGAGRGRGLRLLLQNPDLLNNPTVRARLQSLAQDGQRPFLQRLGQRALLQSQNQSHVNDEPSPNTSNNQPQLDNIPQIQHLVVFPPSPFVTPIEGVAVSGFQVFSYAGRVEKLLQSAEPSQWISSKTTLTDATILDDLILNFISLTHADCPATLHQKAAALMYIKVMKPNQNSLLGKGEKWHRDPSPWPVNDGHIPTRYAITLLGDSTRILDPELGEAPELGRYVPQVFAEERRLHIGQIIRFSMGSIESPVHSAPAVTKDRVFINIVYGSEREVMANRKNIPWRG